MSDQTDKRMSPEDYTWAGYYAELAERYNELPALQSVPYMAVRLLVMRHGFDNVMKVLREEKKGTPWVAAHARQEIATRQQFLARMVVEFPPEDPADIEKAATEMAEDLAAIDCVEGGLRLLNYLERLRLRELRFAERSSTVH